MIQDVTIGMYHTIAAYAPPPHTPVADSVIGKYAGVLIGNMERTSETMFPHIAGALRRNELEAVRATRASGPDPSGFLSQNLPKEKMAAHSRKLPVSWN